MVYLLITKVGTLSRQYIPNAHNTSTKSDDFFPRGGGRGCACAVVAASRCAIFESPA